MPSRIEAGSVRRVLLVVPRQSRDLGGHALVAFHLEERFGCDVCLYHGGCAADEIIRFEPDAIVLDYLGWSDRAKEALLAKRLGIRVIVLPTAGLFATTEEYIRAVGVLTGVSHCVDLYLSWGDYVARALVAGGVLPPKAVEVVGCPRFDFYSEQFLSTVEERGRLLGRIGFARSDPPRVVWTTNTNNFNSPGQVRMTEKIARGVYEGKLAEDEVERQLQDEETQFRVHSKVVLDLARRNPGWNILIKVHPLECVSPYLDLVRGVSNLRVSQDIATRDLLYHTSVLLQRGCTTATEAWMLGKPVLELDIGAFRMSWAPPEHRNGSEVVRDVESAESAIHAYLAGKALSAKQLSSRASFLRERYFRVDGHSSERCADAIHRALREPDYSDEEQAGVRAATRAESVLMAKGEGTKLKARLKAVLGVRSGFTWRGAWSPATLRRLLSRRPTDAISEDIIAQLYAHYRELLERHREAGGVMLSKWEPRD